MLDSPTPTRLQARYVLFGAVAVVLTIGATAPEAATHPRPTTDAEVLAQVPARSDAEVRALSALQQSALAKPGDLPQALVLAQKYIEASRREGDPRYLGAAEAALARWTERADPPAAVRVLRATILQSRHEFDAALVDLKAVLKTTPDDAQAWLTRATIETVQGDYLAARESCRQLEPLVSESYSAACVAPLDALTGHAAAAHERLASALGHARTVDERAWLLSLAGEQSYWHGDTAQAEQALRGALSLAPEDRYSRAVYADLLLDGGRASEAQALLSGQGSDDALALRSALAALSLGQADAPLVRQVEEAFASSRLRGDTVHRREEARFWLARGEEERALGCALESFSVQHEPWDARLVLESALAAEQPAAAAPVVSWLEATHFESPKLRALAARLKAVR
jgi:Tfp pilus assembly protein PilF